MAKKNIAKKFPSQMLITLVIITILGGLGMLVTLAWQTDYHHEREIMYKQHQVYNAFLTYVDTGEEVTKLPANVKQLAADLKNYSDLETINSPFIPKSMATIYVPHNTYMSIENEIGCKLSVESDGSTCDSHGYFREDFIQDYTAASNNQSTTVINPLQKPFLGYVFTPWAIPFWMYGLILYGIAMIFFVLIHLEEPDDYNDREEKTYTPKQVWFWCGFIFWPLGYTFFGLRQIYRQHETNKIEKERLAEERAKIIQHPMRAQLTVAQRRLRELRMLVQDHPNDKNIQNTYLECSKVVVEMESLPNKLSELSARWLANEYAGEFSSYSTETQSRIDAMSGIEKL